MGFTFFQLIVGPGAFFEMGKQRSLAELKTKDCVENTIIAAIAANPVPWTMPADLLFLPNEPLPVGRSVGRYPTPIFAWLFNKGEAPSEANRYQYLFADGSIEGGYSRFSKEKLRPFITWQGREKVDRQSLYDSD